MLLIQYLYFWALQLQIKTTDTIDIVFIDDLFLGANSGENLFINNAGFEEELSGAWQDVPGTFTRVKRTGAGNQNDAPIFYTIRDRNAVVGKEVLFTVHATDNNGDALIYSAENLPDGAEFNADSRIFSWTPGYTQTGEYKVTFIVGDGTATDSEEITITVYEGPSSR